MSGLFFLKYLHTLSIAFAMLKSILKAFRTYLRLLDSQRSGNNNHYSKMGCLVIQNARINIYFHLIFIISPPFTLNSMIFAVAWTGCMFFSSLPVPVVTVNIEYFNFKSETTCKR